MQKAFPEKADESSSPSPVRTENDKMGSSSEHDGEVKEEADDMAFWLPWPFQCLDGYEAQAGIGLRYVGYKAHTQEFGFTPYVEEDVLGERWTYDLYLWCDTEVEEQSDWEEDKLGIESETEVVY